MSVMHLDRDSYAALRAGTIAPAEARALAGHLAEPCEACEAFLAVTGEADGLDGAVDLALAAAAPPVGGAGDDLEFARIMKAVRAPARTASPGRARRLAAAAAALAAVVMIAGVAALLLPERFTGERWDGLKGDSAQAVPLRLRFLVVHPGPGGAPEVERGVAGQEVPAAASLQFQVSLGRPAYVTLVRAGGRGAGETFFEGRLGTGHHLIEVAGHPAEYPLASLAGPQRFLALASEERIDPADAARAVTLGAGPRRGEGPAISLDVIEVRVRP